MLHPVDGLGCKHAGDGAPDFNRCLQAKDMRKHIRGERVHEVTRHLLVSLKPGDVSRVGDELLLLGILVVLNLQCGGRRGISAVEQAHGARTAQRREHQRLPKEEWRELGFWSWLF